MSCISQIDEVPYNEALIGRVSLRIRGGCKWGKVNLREYKIGWSWREGFMVLLFFSLLLSFGLHQHFHPLALFRQLATSLARVSDSVWPFHLLAITPCIIFCCTPSLAESLWYKFISKETWQHSKWLFPNVLERKKSHKILWRVISE